MLLVLFSQEGIDAAQKVTRLAEQVKAPMTTAVRWLDYLEQRKLIQRQTSNVDRREVLVSLTPYGRSCLLSYLETLTKDRMHFG